MRPFLLTLAVALVAACPMVEAASVPQPGSLIPRDRVKPGGCTAQPGRTILLSSRFRVYRARYGRGGHYSYLATCSLERRRRAFVLAADPRAKTRFWASGRWLVGYLRHTTQTKDGPVVFNTITIFDPTRLIGASGRGMSMAPNGSVLSNIVVSDAGVVAYKAVPSGDGSLPGDGRQRVGVYLWFPLTGRDQVELSVSPTAHDLAISGDLLIWQDQGVLYGAPLDGTAPARAMVPQ